MRTDALESIQPVDGCPTCNGKGRIPVAYSHENGTDVDVCPCVLEQLDDMRSRPVGPDPFATDELL